MCSTRKNASKQVKGSRHRMELPENGTKFVQERILKVVGNEKIGGSGMYQCVPIWLGPWRSRFVSLSNLLSSLILLISVSAPVIQNE